MLFWHSCFFDDPNDVGILISGSSAFSNASLDIWKLLIDVLLKPDLENFVHYFANMWNACNCAVVWTFFGIALLWELGFHGSSAGKESTYNVGHLGSVPGLRRSPGEGKGYPLQYSVLENHKNLDMTEGLSLSLGLEWKLIISSPVATAQFSMFTYVPQFLKKKKKKNAIRPNLAQFAVPALSSTLNFHLIAMPIQGFCRSAWRSHPFSLLSNPFLSSCIRV